MLVLARKLGEAVVVGGEGLGDRRVTITVVKIDGGQIKLGIEAPPDVTVHREEVQAEIDRNRSDG